MSFPPDPDVTPRGSSDEGPLGPGDVPAPGANAPPAGATGAARTLTAQALDRLLGILDRVVPAARAVRLAVTVLAGLAAGAVLVLAVAVVVAAGPLNWVGWLGLLGLVAILVIPSFLLVGLRWLLSGLVELPERLRREPGLRKDQVQHLAALAAGEDPGAPDGPRPKAMRVGTAVRILLSARGDLLAYTVLLRLASVPYLIVSAVAAVAAAAEVVVLPLAAAALVVAA